MKKIYRYVAIILMIISFVSLPMKRTGEKLEEKPEKFLKVETVGQETFETLPPEIHAALLPFIAAPPYPMTRQEANKRFESDMQQLSKALQNLRLTSKRTKELIDDKGVIVGMIIELVKRYSKSFITIAQMLKIPAAKHLVMQTKDTITKIFSTLHHVDYGSLKQYKSDQNIRFISKDSLGLPNGSSFVVGNFISPESHNYIFFIVKFNARGEIDQTYGVQGFVVPQLIISENRIKWTDFMIPGPATFFETILPYLLLFRTGNAEYIYFVSDNGTLESHMGHHGLISFIRRTGENVYENLLMPLWQKTADYQPGDIITAFQIINFYFDQTQKIFKCTIELKVRRQTGNIFVRTIVVPLSWNTGNIVTDAFNPALTS